MFKYGEDQVLQQAFDYIASTYGGHYTGDGDDQGIQLFDYWQSLGILQPMAAGTAIKYLARFGKKGGHNKKDLLKAIHYTVLLWYATYGNEDEPKSDVDPDEDQLIEAEEGPSEQDVTSIEDFLNRIFARAQTQPFQPQ